jgi:hypothetical protein
MSSVQCYDFKNKSSLLAKIDYKSPNLGENRFNRHFWRKSLQNRQFLARIGSKSPLFGENRFKIANFWRESVQNSHIDHNTRLNRFQNRTDFFRLFYSKLSLPNFFHALNCPKSLLRFETLLEFNFLYSLNQKILFYFFIFRTNQLVTREENTLQIYFNA